jgi:hypothetical protein
MFNIPSFFGFRAGSSYDSDAAAFFARVDAATGVSNFLTVTEKDAVNDLVLQMKTDLIWTSMKAIYPMVGGGTGTLAQRQAACSQNLVSSSFTGSFTATGWTFASTGATPNGNDATYMDTGFRPSLHNIANSAHISFYSRTNIITSKITMGCYDGTNYNQLAISFAGTTFWNINNASGSTVVSSATNSLGLFLASRTSATAVMGQRNATQITGIAAENRNPFNIWIGRPNNITSYADTKECAFASIGDGLTTTEGDLFYTAVQAFQTTLSRQV